MEDTFESLLAESRAYKRHVFADSTITTYKSHLRAYMRYCAYYQRTPVPADQDTIIGYITFLARSISANSIPGYLNIISLLSSAAGLPNPLAKNWEVRGEPLDF